MRTAAVRPSTPDRPGHGFSILCRHAGPGRRVCTRSTPGAAPQQVRIKRRPTSLLGQGTHGGCRRGEDRDRSTHCCAGRGQCTGRPDRRRASGGDTARGEHRGQLRLRARCSQPPSARPAAAPTPPASRRCTSRKADLVGARLRGRCRLRQRVLVGAAGRWDGRRPSAGCRLTYARLSPTRVSHVGAAGGDIDTAFAPVKILGRHLPALRREPEPRLDQRRRCPTTTAATFTTTPVQAGIPIDDREWIAAVRRRTPPC